MVVNTGTDFMAEKIGKNMIISHERKFIFLRTRKTAGVSIQVGEIGGNES
jgi:hypothetical protein